jgi:HEAT repeat protein
VRARTAFLVALAAALPAKGEDPDAEKRAREAAAQAKEEARIHRRRELRDAFTAEEKIAADRFEAFALEPIRDWDKGLRNVLAEPPEALRNPLRYYLLDDDWEVQAFACRVTGGAGLADLLPELEQAYDDARYPVIRRMAVEAAASFARAKQEPLATALLDKGLKDAEPGVRLHAIDGLEALKDLPRLRTAAEDKDLDARYKALGVLARLGDEEAGKRLLDGFRSYVANRDQRRRASLEIYDVGERYAQFLNALALGYWGSPAAVKLLAVALVREGDYKNKLFLSIGAAAALGRARPEDKDAQAERERALRNAIGDGDGTVRAVGAFAAGFTADEKYVRLVQRLIGDAQPDVRHNAVEALGKLPGQEAVSILAGVLSSERDVPVRLAAVRALSRHPEPDAAAALVPALRDKVYMVRQAAARMLGRRGTEAAPAAKALAKAARDADYGVREQAVVALGRVGADEGLPAIVDALGDRDEGVRIRALRALGRFPNGELARANGNAAERAVRLLVTASGIDQRTAAQEALVRIRSPLAVPHLLREIDADSHSRRMAAFLVLKEYNGGRTLDYAPEMQGTERRGAVKRWQEWWSGGGPIAPEPPPPTRRANLDLPLFHRYTRDLRWRGIDLVLAYDSTGSMLPVIRAVQQRLDLLLEETARVVPNLRLSLFTYRDEGEEYVYYGTPLTYSTENLKAFIQVAEANRGGDLPEAVTATVKAAVERLAWRPAAQKVIVVIGDAPYHPENEAALFTIAREFARKENHGTIHAIYTDPNRLGESISARRRREASGVTYPFLERLNEMAKAGGGRAITIEDTEALVTEILIHSFGEQWRAELESRLDFE